MLGAVGGAFVEQPPRACYPSRRLRLHRRPFEHREGEPDRVARRGDRVTAFEKTLVRTRERIEAGGILADKKGGSRQAFQIVRFERRLAVGLREQVAGVRPRLPRECVSAACERSSAAHARSIS